MATVTVRIFSSHPVALRQYTRALSSDPEIRLVGSDSGFQVAVFDGEQKTVEQAIALARLKAPNLKPILISEPCDDAECLRWMMNGMWGVIAYARFDRELPAAVRQVASGQLWFPPEVVMRWMQMDAELHVKAQGTPLTEREREVTELLVRRLSNKEIANMLRISERTVKFHVANVLAKLRVKSRQELSTIWLPPVRSA